MAYLITTSVITSSLLRHQIIYTVFIPAFSLQSPRMCLFNSVFSHISLSGRRWRVGAIHSNRSSVGRDEFCAAQFHVQPFRREAISLIICGMHPSPWPWPMLANQPIDIRRVACLTDRAIKTCAMQFFCWEKKQEMFQTNGRLIGGQVR